MKKKKKKINVKHIIVKITFFSTIFHVFFFLRKSYESFNCIFPVNAIILSFVNKANNRKIQ